MYWIPERCGFADDVMTLTKGQGVDVVLNSLAGEAINRNFSVLRPFGRFLELGKRDFYENTRESDSSPFETIFPISGESMPIS